MNNLREKLLKAGLVNGLALIHMDPAAAKTYLRNQLQLHAYRYSATPFTLKSGGTSHHYMDCRSVLMHPVICAQAAEVIRAHLHQIPQLRDPLHQDDIVIAGVVLGAIPLVNEVVSQEWHRNSRIRRPVYVRPEAKDHGTKKLVEKAFDLAGVLDVPCVLLEDVWTTGGSAIKAKAALEADGFKVLATIVLVDREEGNLRPDFALFKLSDFAQNGA